MIESGPPITDLTLSNGRKKVPLTSLAEIFSGLPLYRLRYRPGAQVSVIQVKDIKHANEPGWTLSRVPVPDSGQIERYRVKVGDVLVTARGTNLKSCIVSEEWGGALLTSNLILVRLGEQLRPQLLLAFFQSSSGRQAMERRLAGSSLLVLTPKILGEIEVPLLPAARQDALADLFTLGETQYIEAIAAAQARRQLAYRIVLDSLLGKDKQSKDGELS